MDWRIECDGEAFEKCQADAKFPYIVALARAVNALNFVMLQMGQHDGPEARRGRTNSYLFASAILYESLKLIRAMNKTFMDDPAFQNGLRSFLRDPVAQSIEKMHLDPARNRAVFHFLPERFTEIISSATVNTCTFLEARGQNRRHVYYSFADVVASEILVGFAADTREFYDALETAMTGTRKLVDRFAEQAEELIGYHTDRWGFKKLEGITSTA